ncbi:hypothetical protein F443_18829, partial [Phytophthora nicotianae P1569]
MRSVNVDILSTSLGTGYDPGDDAAPHGIPHDSGAHRARRAELDEAVPQLDSRAANQYSPERRLRPHDARCRDGLDTRDRPNQRLYARLRLATAHTRWHPYDRGLSHHSPFRLSNTQRRRSLDLGQSRSGAVMDTEDFTYEETLERWALHDCSAVQGDRSADEMIALFNRWRSTRSKPVAARGTVTSRSLDRSWTSFVERWNIE